MKMRLFYLAAIVILAATFAACTADTTTIPSDVRLNQSYATLAPGETLRLTANVKPDYAAVKSVTWNSSNLEVATVNNDGVITAIAEGKAKISVTTNSGQKSKFCELTVVYPVSGVTLDQPVSVLSVGKSARLTATVLPEDAPDISVRWESSAPDIVTVNDEGEIVAKAPGAATITVITVVGHRTASCTVKIPSSENYIAIILQLSKGVYFFIAGSGTVEIDWGDGSAIETKMLSAAGLNYSHSYSDMLTGALIISGVNITRFDYIVH
jgi:uncharacterized protein YjdB